MPDPLSTAKGVLASANAFERSAGGPLPKPAKEPEPRKSLYRHAYNLRSALGDPSLAPSLAAKRQNVESYLDAEKR